MISKNNSFIYAMGMSRTDGKLLNPSDHLRQSIHDILTTPLGSRLMRRSYGSLLPFLIDEPMSIATKIKMMSAIASALVKWEPRIKVRQITLSMNDDGTNDTGNVGWNAHLDLRLADNSLFSTSLTLVRGAS